METREPGEDRRRGPRVGVGDDAFGRILGDEWVAVEPGIYRLASDLQAEAERERRRQEARSLAESLLDAIPGREDEVPEPPPETPTPAGRSWWRRRLAPPLRANRRRARR
jgi:hypothetical protein